MKRIPACDVCLAEGKFGFGYHSIGYKHGRVKLDACNEHRRWGMGDFKTVAEWESAALELSVKAEAGYNQWVRDARAEYEQLKAQERGRKVAVNQ